MLLPRPRKQLHKPGWRALQGAQNPVEILRARNTETGQERWSVFAGPSLHYGGKDWWGTLTYFNQLTGGGEQYINQTDDGLHLIEKSEHELRSKLGYNF